MTTTDTQLREFLLRRMPAENAARLEEAIIVEDGVAERLRAEEFDLIDDYAAGRLSAEDRASVEHHLLTATENVHSLRIARLLARESASREAPSEPSASPSQVVRVPRRHAMGRRAWAGALLAAGLAGVVMIPQWTGTRHQPIATLPTAASADRPAPQSAQSPLEATTPLPILTLLADADRGSTRPILRWRADLASVRLQAEVSGPERDTLYSLRIYDTAGHRLFEGAALPVHAAGRYRFVDTTVPTTALGPGPRTISLQAADAIADAPPEYTWQVVGVLD
jgi:hypothetical protein